VSPKTVDRESKQQHIVHAAMLVFARSGVHQAKMADIAAEAGIGKGTIYEYFRSKDEIFAAAFVLFQQQIDAESEGRLDGQQDPEDKLRAMVEAFISMMTHDDSVIEIMLEFWAEGIRQRHEALDLKPMYCKYRAYLAACVEEGIESGVFRPVDSHLVASHLLAALDGFALQWFVDRQCFSLQQAGEQLMGPVLAGIKA